MIFAAAITILMTMNAFFAMKRAKTVTRTKIVP